MTERNTAPILLVDGDELLHVALAALEVETDWGQDIWTLSVNAQEAREAINRKLRSYREAICGGSMRPEGEFFPHSVVVAFSGGENWRKALDPSYKANRKGSRKPMCYAQLRWAAMTGRLFPKDVACSLRTCLEADDVLGILATKPGNVGRTIIISKDKDFLGVPGKLWRLERTKEMAPVILEISEADADRWHLVQALAGDTADGYPGCPGIGVDTAEDLLSKGLKFVRTERTLSRGKNAGSTVVEWERHAAASAWETVESCYERAGLTEEDALLQARLARICRWDDWDSKEQKVKLWAPG